MGEPWVARRLCETSTLKLEKTATTPKGLPPTFLTIALQRATHQFVTEKGCKERNKVRKNGEKTASKKQVWGMK